MAVFEELYLEYNKITQNIEKLKEKLKQKTRYDELSIKIEQLENDIEELNLNDDKTSIENELKAKKEEKKKLKTEKTKIYKNLEKAKEELKNTEKKLYQIIEQFAAEPRINDCIRKELIVRFDMKLQKQENAINEVKEKQKKFNSYLKENSNLKNLIEEARKSYKEVNSKIEFKKSNNVEEKKEYKELNKQYKEKREQLKQAIQSEYTDVVVSSSMLKKIIENDENSEYAFKPYYKKLREENSKYAEIREEKRKVLNLIKDIKEKGKPQVAKETVAEKNAAQEKNKIIENNKKAVYEATKQKSSDLENKLEELNQKIKKQRAQIDEKNIYTIKIRNEIAKKGYISTSVFPELCTELAYAFRNADLKVRDAFLDFIEYHDEESINVLNKAIADYEKISGELSKQTGISVADLNNHLKIILNKEIENGKINEYDLTAYDKKAPEKIIKTNLGIEDLENKESLNETVQQLNLTINSILEGNINDKDLLLDLQNKYNKNIQEINNQEEVKPALWQIILQKITGVYEKVKENVKKTYNKVIGNKKEKPQITDNEQIRLDTRPLNNSPEVLSEVKRYNESQKELEALLQEKEMNDKKYTELYKEKNELDKKTNKAKESYDKAKRQTIKKENSEEISRKIDAMKDFPIDKEKFEKIYKVAIETLEKQVDNDEYTDENIEK